MSALGERVLIQHLTSADSMDVLAREGMDAAIVPNDQLRGVYQFALDYYHRSGRTKAPSEAVLRTEYGDLLDDLEIMLEDPEESVEWAIDNLKGTFVHKAASSINKRFATAIAEADTTERVEVFSTFASEMVALSLALSSADHSVDVRQGITDRLLAYEGRANEQGIIRGMRFGIPMIDGYTSGIHPGELAILAAPPKTGKSYFLCRTALGEWQHERPTVLFSLENSVEMTLDRILCLACGVDGRLWEHGRCTPEEIERVHEFADRLYHSPVPLWVVAPDRGKRSIEHMVREAQVRGAASMLVDQLTFIEMPDPRKPRHERIGDMLHHLVSMIGTGRDRLSCLMAHQINREGVKAAKKLGYLEMEHMAEAAEVERTAAWVFGLFQSHDERAAKQAKFQTLGARREDNKHFLMTWHISRGAIDARNEITLAA